MSHLPKNDPSHLYDLPGTERIQAALVLRGKIEDLEARLAPLMKQQRPNEPKFADWDKLEFDPDRRLTPHQVRLHEAFVLGGRAGLAHKSYDFCKEHYDQTHKGSETDRHRHILDDFENGAPRMKFLLMTMHTDILHAMIDGNMSSRYHRDEKFRLIIYQYAQPTEALPMIYLNQLARVKHLADPEQPWAGRFLSWTEWVLTLTALKQYKNECKQQHRSPWVLKVDNSCPTNEPLKDNATCRFLTNDNQHRHLEVFIGACDSRYVKAGQALFDSDPADARLDIPFDFSPCEVGFALKGQQRVSDHTTLKQSNWLLSLVYSTVRALFGKDKFEMKQYKILELGDPYDAQVAESTCSEIPQSYWYKGGYNPELAGTIAVEGKSSTTGKAITLSKNEPLFQEARKDILSRPYIRANITEEREGAEEVCRVIREVRKESVDVTWDQVDVLREQLKRDLPILKDRIEGMVIAAYKEQIEALRDSEAAEMSSQK